MKKKNKVVYCHVVLQMHMPNEQGRFEMAHSIRLHNTQNSGGPLKDWLFCRYVCQTCYVHKLWLHFQFNTDCR